MTPPLIDTTAALAVTPNRLTPQQRLDSTLNQLSTASTSSLLSDADQTSIKTGELVEPIQRINTAMRVHGLEFDVSEESSRVVTRVIDRESGEVIRQIPAEEVLAIAERLEEIQGRLISLEV
ncbi:MAG: flagellar protein FlaG [Halomonadaceae bacterium]|uniref:Flagellar protein FlaG n=1 Tax=Halomonas colorata TaxID=2742615 RepID=A0ABR9FT95_9GAMM|nr:flagellar protein FlaG [Halomonas colorata]MBE0461870.1 flagellar protein FlaG [Halomonas colorata]